MFCKNCGHKNNDHAAFCVKCGQKIEANAQSSLPKLDTFQSTSAKQVIETRKNQHKQKKKNISFIIGGVVVLAVLSFFVFTKVFGSSTKNMNPLEMIYVGIDEVTDSQGFDFEFIAENDYGRENYSGSIALGKDAKSSRLSLLNTDGDKITYENDKATITYPNQKSESENDILNSFYDGTGIDLEKYIKNNHLDKDAIFEETVTNYVNTIAAARFDDEVAEQVMQVVPSGDSAWNLFSDFIKNGLNDKETKEKVFINVKEVEKNKYDFQIDALALFKAFDDYLTKAQNDTKLLKEIGMTAQNVRTLSNYVGLALNQVQNQIDYEGIDPTIVNPHMTVGLDNKNRLTEFSVDSITDEEYDVDTPFVKLTISNINKPSFN
ncbi:zinc ribbon domain-containing protein [uncultured Enterococcus sp.]|uniref:zinc ribbon domain-containing protein n=1 Tax=uncultured Enterococcus sp. TaxID=167972 RepID=UPI0025D22379|nr:zinc ribbon domain-containing protein [uncultured Enterococcus sp.]